MIHSSAVDLVVEVLMDRYRFSPARAFRLIRLAAERKGVAEDDLAAFIVFQKPLQVPAVVD